MRPDRNGEWTISPSKPEPLLESQSSPRLPNPKALYGEFMHLNASLFGPQQIFYRYIQRFCGFENDVPAGELACPFPIGPRGLWNADNLTKFILRQAFLCAEVMQPCSIRITPRLWFSPHQIIIIRPKKVVAYYQYIDINWCGKILRCFWRD